MAVAERPRLLFGKYFGSNRVTNPQLAKLGIVTKHDDFSVSENIERKFGMVWRPEAREFEDESFMGIQSGRGVVELIHDEIKYVLYSMSYPRKNDPLKDFEITYDLTPQFDRYYHAACSGSVLALTEMKDMEQEARGRRFVLVASERYRNVMEDPRKDPSRSMFMFGDGASMMSGVYGEDFRVLHYRNFDAFTEEERNTLRMPIDYSNVKEGSRVVPIPVSESGKFEMDGGGVLRAMQPVLTGLIPQTVEEAGFKPGDIDWVVTHQASLQMLERTAKRMPDYKDKFIYNLEGGNLSSATVTLAMETGINIGLITRGMRLVLVGFGAGLFVSVAVIELG